MNRIQRRAFLDRLRFLRNLYWAILIGGTGIAFGVFVMAFVAAPYLGTFGPDLQAQSSHLSGAVGLFLGTTAMISLTGILDLLRQVLEALPVAGTDRPAAPRVDNQTSSS